MFLLSFILPKYKKRNQPKELSFLKRTTQIERSSLGNLSVLPDEILLLIISFLNIIEQDNFAVTCQTFRLLIRCISNRPETYKLFEFNREATKLKNNLTHDDLDFVYAVTTLGNHLTNAFEKRISIHNSVDIYKMLKRTTFLLKECNHVLDSKNKDLTTLLPLCEKYKSFYCDNNLFKSKVRLEIEAKLLANSAIEYFTKKSAPSINPSSSE